MAEEKTIKKKIEIEMTKMKLIYTNLMEMETE